MSISKKNIYLKSPKYYNYVTNIRFNILCTCIVMMILLLIIRLTYLQLIYTEKLTKEGNLRSLRIKTIPTSRGIISDRFGNVLAISVQVNAILINPKKIYNKINSISSDIRWKIVSKVLSIPIKKIIYLVSKNSKKSFLYLARHVNTNISNYITQLNINGISLQEEERRYYPSSEETSQLIGITNIDGKGIEGIEKSFDKLLTGSSGLNLVRQDKFGNVIENINSVKAKPPLNIVLSIDKRLQSLMYREIKKAVVNNKAESGSAVLIDIKTGEIHGIVNSPAYNPNNLHKKNIYSAIRNRAITDIFEPGSTVKPMVIMTALKMGIVNKNSIISTIPYKINGHEIKDIKLYSKLTLTGILQKSSNVGISRLALSMPYSKLIDTYSSFGIGKSTALGLVGENSGYYLHKKKWSKIERATFAFGYGLMVTPLQLARVYATIGSYGVYRPLSIIKVTSPVSGKIIFPKSIVKTVIHMMESVALPGGSGSKAAIKGYNIAIKTGTTKKVGKNNHYIDKYIAYTAGIAPSKNPLFALVVIINNPQAGKYYGGTISAPVFGIIMKNVLRTMNIKPDILPIKKNNINK